MQIVLVRENGETFPVVEVTGVSSSEVTGPTFDPSGTRLYFSSHLHQQGRRRDEASASASLVGPVAAEDVGVDVPLGVRADPPPRRATGSGYPSSVHDLRPGRRRCASPATSSATSASTRSGSRPASVHAAISAGQERARLRRRLRRARPRSIYERQDRRRLPRVPELACARAGAMDFDDLLGKAVEPLPDAARRARALPAPLQARPGRRVPGHQHRPERAGPAPAPRSTATSASWATATSACPRAR